MSLVEVQSLLRKYRIKPDSSKGQVFLTDDTDLNGIVDSAGIRSTDTVIEVGPGIGNLTVLLAERAQKIITVEIDERFKPVLEKISSVNSNVRVVYRDILSLPFKILQDEAKILNDGDYILVANIPYYLTAKLISRILSYTFLPRSISFLLQKEVAERICATAGSHTKLSLSVQFYGMPQIVMEISRDHFFPKPVVDSALLNIQDIHRWSFPESEKQVWQLIRIGFSTKRKKLINNLSAGLQKTRPDLLVIFQTAGIDENARAESLHPDEWRHIAANLSSKSA